MSFDRFNLDKKHAAKDVALELLLFPFAWCRSSSSCWFAPCFVLYVVLICWPRHSCLTVASFAGEINVVSPPQYLVLIDFPCLIAVLQYVHLWLRSASASNNTGSSSNFLQQLWKFKSLLNEVFQGGYDETSSRPYRGHPIFEMNRNQAFRVRACLHGI